MTEPENFDDDLFADLYNDDEPSARPAVAAEKVAPPPAAAATPIDTYDEADHAPDHGVEADTHMGEEYDEDDDDVDFNLGNGASTTHHVETPTYSAPAPAPVANKGPNSKEDGKMFIGGLNWETTDQSLREYFSQFGEVIECTVMRDGTTGRSRGFGFLTFKDPKTVNVVMVKEHHLDGKIIDPKRAIPRDEQEKTSKIFVGGVSQETTDQEFRDYFAQFGRVIDSTLMMDKDTGRPRGFGFVTFESEAGVDACLAANLEIHGKPIEVKKAQPRGNMREEEEASRRGSGGKFRKGAATSGSMDDQGSAGQQMGGAAGMTPQMMAQYWQRMQQYFTLMQQQQQMMNRGMGMGGMAMGGMGMGGMGMGMGGMGGGNLAALQMMQQQQQQQMMAAQGRGGPAGGNPMMGNMNPQMMQQMQAMMAQQQGGGGGQGGGQGGGPQGANRQGYGAMEQQMFEEQKYEHQQGNRRGGGGQGGQGAGRDQQQQGYAMGGGPPTSWEGMYDDVPQPNPNQGGRGGFHRRGGGHHHQQQQQMNPADPNNAPPANAPTGPKNAGRPGANYRGGGRGGNRGYHPYARG